jgi:hypothetical protein
MSAADGYVAGKTKVVDHGPDNVRWNLVILGDGYQASQLATYHTDVQNFLNRLRATPPYDELFCGINVYRIDIVSTDSGADEPTACGGPGTTPRTYFDATFCSVGPGGVRIERLLTVNSALALSIATAQVTLKHQVLVIVNSSKYGGSGGEVATCSTHVQASEIAIHEIGHSAYGLADEYGGNGVGSPPGEFPEPNVTRDTNRATNKWRALIDASTPMPSACDASCAASTCVAPATPPAAGAVGTYEGGNYSDCNTYRPLPSCYMRDYGPFCPVCSGVIRQTINPFLPAESVNLVTPSIQFLNVPSGIGGIGVTTHRAIVLEVVSCRSLTFEMMMPGPTGGFGTPMGRSVSVTADPILPAAQARLWLSYTSTNPGDTASGSVTVRCVQTMQTWTINIVANTITRPRAAVTLVLDRSGSMNDDVQKLREAANVFISVMQPADGIGLVRFNETAQRLMEVEDAGPTSGPSGRATALAHIAGSDIDPDGATSIGDGVVNGKQMLDDAQAAATPHYDVQAMVVLTDGQWNQPPDLSTVSGSITSATYAVGLGLPSNISVPALTTLCQGHSGFLLVTGQVSPDQSMRLSKYFLQILAGVTNAQIAADPHGVLDITSEHRIPFWLSEADYGADLILLSPVSQLVDFQLEAPDGLRIAPASGAGGANSQFVSSRFAAYYRCALPMLPASASGSHAGLWHAVLSLAKPTPGVLSYSRLAQDYASHYHPQRAVLPYEFVAHAYSSLTFQAHLTQASFELGAVVRLTAVLHEYDVPVQGRARMWAEIVRPDGMMDAAVLREGVGGAFATSYTLHLCGVYTFRLRARGETMRSATFERERTLTASAVPGADRWSPHVTPENALRQWLRCLSRAEVLDKELLERLHKMGIDVAALLKCVDGYCHPATDSLDVSSR